MKLTKLTPKQESLLSKYRDEGIEIGLATSSEPINEELVRQLTDSHRELCGVPKASDFLIFDSPFAALKSLPALSITSALYGQHDINWLQFYQFFRKECNIKNLDKIQYLHELTKHVGWMWMSTSTTVVTRRPVEIRLQQKPNIKVLHNYNGMALKYADGTGVYSINGVRIPKQFAHLVNAYSDDINIKEVLSIKNTEIRTEFLKKIGIEKAFDSLNKKKLDSKVMDIGGTYELFSILFGDLERKYLRGECPSNNEPFFEAVHPKSTTVEEALSYRNTGELTTTFKTPLKLT